VVKNVTGYDLCKLMAGSWGTLAAMTDVTVKTLPRAEAEATVLVVGLEDARAVEAMAAATACACDVSGAAHLPAGVAMRASIHVPATRAVTALRLEGVAPSVDHRQQTLQALMKPFGEVALLPGAQSRDLWRGIRDVLPFAVTAPAGRRAVWRISTAPGNGAKVGHAIAVKADVELMYDWAGGLVWAALLPSDDGGAAPVRAAVAAFGGHATLIRAPGAVRAAVAVFEPQEGSLATLTRRVKEGFDPLGVLGPGRMWAGV
jgi:glycolate oxidase FAD binding subunit